MAHNHSLMSVDVSEIKCSHIAAVINVHGYVSCGCSSLGTFSLSLKCVERVWCNVYGERICQLQLQRAPCTSHVAVANGKRKSVRWCAMCSVHICSLRNMYAILIWWKTIRNHLSVSMHTCTEYVQPNALECIFHTFLRCICMRCCAPTPIDYPTLYLNDSTATRASVNWFVSRAGASFRIHNCEYFALAAVTSIKWCLPYTNGQIAA